MHERDQDTDLALLIVRKFIRTVSPHVRFTLVYFFTPLAEGNNFNNVITAIEGHVNEYSIMHYFGNPRHNQSMIAYIMILKSISRSSSGKLHCTNVVSEPHCTLTNSM